MANNKIEQQIPKDDKKDPTPLVKCSCKSEYQDKRYGKGIRIANRRDPSKHKGEAKCTVCGSIKTL